MVVPSARFYAYVVRDVSEPDLEKSVRAVRMTRKAARDRIVELAAEGADVSSLRVRRAKVTLFES